jgi:hypothetical protein
MTRVGRLILVLALLTGGRWPAGSVRHRGALDSRRTDVEALEPGRAPAALVAPVTVKIQSGAARSAHAHAWILTRALAVPALDRVGSIGGVLPSLRGCSACSPLRVRGPPDTL